MGKVAVETIPPEKVWSRLRRDWLVVRGFRLRSATGEGQALCSWRSVGDEWFELVAARREQLACYEKKSADRARGSDAEGKIEGASVQQSSALESSALVVMIADADPVDFLAGFWAALLSGWSIALANAKWGHQEWQSAYTLIKPQLIWHNSPTSPLPHSPTPPLPHSPTPPLPHSPTPLLSPSSLHRPLAAKRAFPAILIPTGGSSGQLKFVHHTWQTLTASVTGFHQHFFPTSVSTSSPIAAHQTTPLTPVNAYCVLPLYHVSGLLQALRTALTNGQLFLTPFKALFPSSPCLVAERSRSPSPTFISLVPTQLNRLLRASSAAWLAQFHAVLLGGAPPWSGLLKSAIAQKIPLCLSYGMTETAAMVSATAPNIVAQNVSPSGSGHMMPHAKITIERANQSLSIGEVGQVVVRSGAIALGYHSAPSPSFSKNTFYTDDLGYLDADGTLHITGRASGKIISGGENIYPAEVEAALRNTGQVLDVCVVGLPDFEWGEVVSAAYVPTSETVSPESLKALLVEASEINRVEISEKSTVPALSRYKVPKRWFPLQCLPRNAQGKINRAALLIQLKTISSLSAQSAVPDGDGFEH